MAEMDEIGVYITVGLVLFGCSAWLSAIVVLAASILSSIISREEEERYGYTL